MLPKITFILAVMALLAVSNARVVSKAKSSNVRYNPYGKVNPNAKITRKRKAGLAFPKQSTCLNLFTNSRSWVYNWEAVPDGVPNGSEFVPTCRGGVNIKLCDCLKEPLENVKYIFGPNEPDKADQDKFNESRGKFVEIVEFWDVKMKPLGKKYKLGAPSISNSNIPGEGIDYLVGFMKACKHCQIDFINVHWHWYGAATAEEYLAHFKAHILKIHEMFTHLPIWVSEFSAQGGSPTEIAKFLKAAMKWMDAQPWIFRYAYFQADKGNASAGYMVNPNGTLNEVGLVYNSYVG